MRQGSSLLAILALLFSVSTLTAQPPRDIFRWNAFGGLSQRQSQGFNFGDPLTLTWGYMAAGTTLNDGSENNFPEFLDVVYGSSATYQPIIASTFDRWSQVSGMTFVFEANDDGARMSSRNRGIDGVRADIRIGGTAIDGDNGTAGFAFFPTYGDTVLDTSDAFFNNTSNNSLRIRNVIAHECGHAVGIAHVDSSDSRQLLEPFLSTSFDGPQYHDIFLAHRGYGDVNEKGLGNDNAGNATQLGIVLSGTSISIGNDARGLVVRANEVDFVSIDDESDTDVFSFTVASRGTTDVLLEALGETYLAGEQDGNQSAFDTSVRSDLVLEILDTDGTTVLASQDANALGGDETLNDIELDAGTYFVRVSGDDNPDALRYDTQFFGLTVSFQATSAVGDFNGDLVVDCDDLDGYVGNIGAAADGPLAVLDLDGDGMLTTADVDTHIGTLVQTSNGQVGTFPGDLNCDGTVNILEDAIILIGNLGSSVTSYSDGDVNFDGIVNVLGDAFVLIANLGKSNNP